MAAMAVEAWDERWATPEGRAEWLVPHPAVTALLTHIHTPRSAVMLK